MRRAIAAIALTALLASSEALQARERPAVAWRDIPAYAAGKDVEVRDGGNRWTGRVVSVSPEALTIDDREKGTTVIPRAAVQNLRMRKRGKLWTIVGTGIGLGIGIGIGTFVDRYSHNEGTGAPTATAAAVAVPTGLGFLLGFAADGGRKVEVRVID